MDKPDYPDQIVIRFRGTIGVPPRRHSGGRWDLGPSHHPSFTDPDWFARQNAPPAALQAQFAVPMEPVAPPPAGGQGPAPDGISAETLARARRRAEYVMRELTAGDPGVAAGLILGFISFPPEVDDPSLSILHNEAPQSRASQGRRDLGQVTDEVQADFDKRRADSLNEDHLQAAEDDRLGNPLVRESDGRAYDHENEVAAAKQGLERNLKKLQKKLEHEREYRRPGPDKATVEHAEKTVKEIEDFLAEIDERLPGLEVRQGRSNVRRPDGD